MSRVVRQPRYVFGLKDWYEARGVIPGTLLRIHRGDTPGEVIVKTDSHRSTREWVRTVLIGADGGLVLAMLKQVVTTDFDDRMAIAVPDLIACCDRLCWNACNEAQGSRHVRCFPHYEEKFSCI